MSRGRTEGARRRFRSDGGATALEYLGAIIVVVALVLGVSAAGIGGSIGDRIRCAIPALGGGSGGGACASGGDGKDDNEPLADKDFEPPLCTISTISDTAGGKAKLGWFEWGQDYGFQDKTMRANYDVNEDGKVDDKDQLIYTTFTDSASAGVTGGFGGKMGKLGTGSVDLGAGVKVSNGDTWVFKSRDEAESFREDLEKLKMYEMRRTSPGGAEASVGDSILYLFGKGALKDEENIRNRVEDKLKDRHISQASVGVYGKAGGELSINSDAEGTLSGKLGADVKISGDALVTKDDFRGTKSYTYSVKADGTIGAGVDAGGAKKGKHLTGERSATVTVTRDQKTGELLRIDFTQTTETFSGQSGGVGGDNGKDGKDKRGGKGKNTDNSGGSDIGVVTNTIAFEKGAQGDADRAVGQAWLDGGGDHTAAFEYLLDTNAPTSRPGADDPFGQLLFDKGKSSRTTYDGLSDAQEYGFELNLGISIGASISMENKSETLKDAEFLGAPRDGKRDYVPYSYCAK
ncbi:Flp family type IVb pilin [Streptomyces sp. NPDC050509]|uniref:Flp family type IVb pilin n=1 Tax=Streptomyces sp. NPDC050509 TaxID=3365620 RepID=UPI0037A2D3B8